MKKVYSLIIVLLFFAPALSVYSQTVVFTSGFETWAGGWPDGWHGAKTNISADSVSQYTTSVHGGTYAVRLKNAPTATGDHKRFTTQPLTVDSGQVYTITYWARGHGDIRTAMFDGRPGTGYSSYNPYISINSTTWSEYSQSVTCTKPNTAGEFILSVKSTQYDLDNLQVDDVTITTGSGPSTPILTITSPANNATLFGTSASIVFAVQNFVVGNPGTGIDGHIHYTVDGGTAVMQYNTAPISLTSLAAGPHTVVLELVDNNHLPLNPPVVRTVNFTMDANPPNLVTIYDIQYTTDVSGDSPYADEIVSLGGIVTGKHAAGYFVQSGSGAWNGIYVYDNVNQPVMGDSVLLTGTVKEYFKLTEVNLVTSFGIISSANPLPEAVVVDCQGINSEANEGVLVKANHVTCVKVNAGFGMWKIEDQSDTAKVHNLLYTYTPVLNTTYDITGPVFYSFDEFRILPRSSADVVVVTGVNEIDPADAVSVYPNPALNTITITGTRAMEQAFITTAAGQLVLSVDLMNQDQVIMDISALPAGVYSVSLVGKDGKTMARKLIKQETGRR